MSRTIDVFVSCVVKIEIFDEDAIERVTGPGGDEWRESAYGAIKTEKDVVEHWAYNAVANGQDGVDELDGWADMDAGAVRLSVGGLEFD